MYRLFVAIDLPDEVKRKIAAVGAGELSGARRVPSGQLHLTLRFIGDADEGLFKAIKDELAVVRSDSFPLVVRGVGHFPPGRQPRVLWVGVDGSGALKELQQRIESAVIRAGVEAEKRSFSPHITVARLRDTPAAEVRRLEEKNRGFCSGPFPVSEFYLYSSIISRDGAIHRREAVYPLQGP